MDVRELAIPGVFEFTPRTFPDERGVFVSPYQEAAFAKAVGHPLRVAQTNHSRSRRGSVRGLHFADVPPGQAKYVYCPVGALLDVVVDIRVGSPTFGRWEAVRLDDDERRAVYLAEGLGHGFCALTETATVTYLCSTTYRPGHEHGIDPLDPALGITWPAAAPMLSDKDAAAPSLAAAQASGKLPQWDVCVTYVETGVRG
jgi:dTDP-4-dehydrorhamnose 3,5-epimerase